MHLSAYITLAASLLAAAVMLIFLRNQRRRIRSIRRRFVALQGGEERMFTFLHDLGNAIEREPSPAALSRTIADGIRNVLGGCGGAIYFLTEEGDFLAPAYISEDCPPLAAVPEEIRTKAGQDPRALVSHLRLARAPADEGILGHCLASGEPVAVTDLRNHPAVREKPADYPAGISALLAPLRHANRNLGVLAVARPAAEGRFSSNDFAVFRSAAEQSSFAIGTARIHREAHEKRVMEGELRNAREVQRVLLPQDEPVVPGFRISGTNLPARILSGDYYDYIDLGDRRTGVAIADVSGKGVPAGLLMAMCRSSLRSVAPGNSSPSATMAAVNRQIFPDIREDMFISMTYLILEGSEGALTLSRAGHDPALLYRRETGATEVVRSPGLALGIDEGSVFERVTRDIRLEMRGGDCLLLYTDGVREATDENEEEFGMERMAATFRAAAPMGSEAVLVRIQEDLRRFTGAGPQMDDITLVVIEKR